MRRKGYIIDFSPESERMDKELETLQREVDKLDRLIRSKEFKKELRIRKYKHERWSREPFSIGDQPEIKNLYELKASLDTLKMKKYDYEKSKQKSLFTDKELQTLKRWS